MGGFMSCLCSVICLDSTMSVNLLDRLEILGICFNYLKFHESLQIIREVQAIEKVLKYMEVISYDFSSLKLDTIQLITKYNKKKILIKCFGSISDNELKCLSGVHRIDLSYCNSVTDNGLKYLVGVHTIDLSYCNLITDNGLKYLSEVHTINLSHCHSITDNGLKYLSKVKKITLYCDKITQIGLGYLPKDCF
jgi:hypothetical protein